MTGSRLVLSALLTLFGAACGPTQSQLPPDTQSDAASGDGTGSLGTTGHESTTTIASTAVTVGAGLGATASSVTSNSTTSGVGAAAATVASTNSGPVGLAATTIAASANNGAGTTGGGTTGTGTSTGFGGTTGLGFGATNGLGFGSTGGTAGICESCSKSSDCASGFCNTVLGGDFCDSFPCLGNSCGSYTCNSSLPYTCECP